MTDTSQGNTGTGDVTYDLVSILYHALQAAETHDMYIRDAEEAGDKDLAAFFREVKEQDTRRAEQAKELLARRLTRNS
jgi:hypothetical protein